MTDLQRRAGSATRIALRGEVDVATADAIRGAAEAAAADGGGGGLVLDLREVTFMDSQGVSALVDAHRALRQHRLRLVVAHPPSQVVQLLALTGLDQVIDLDG